MSKIFHTAVENGLYERKTAAARYATKLAVVEHRRRHGNVATNARALDVFVATTRTKNIPLKATFKSTRHISVFWSYSINQFTLLMTSSPENMAHLLRTTEPIATSPTQHRLFTTDMPPPYLRSTSAAAASPAARPSSTLAPIWAAVTGGDQ